MTDDFYHRETKTLLELYQANLEWILGAYADVVYEVGHFRRILEDVDKRKKELDKRLASVVEPQE